jgi:tetratricopeptide (TPR) repeat protein
MKIFRIKYIFIFSILFLIPISLIILMPQGAFSSSNKSNRYFNLAMKAINSKKWDIAISELNKAIELNPNDAKLYRFRGAVYASIGNHDNAIKDYNKALEINPKYGDVFGTRAVSWYYKGIYNNALADIQKCQDLNGKIDQNFVKDVERIIKSPLIEKTGWIELQLVGLVENQKESTARQPNIILHSNEETYIIDILPSCIFEVPPEEQKDGGIKFKFGKDNSYFVKGYLMEIKSLSPDGKYVLFSGNGIKALSIKRVDIQKN